jgi:DNA gyrase subunit B
MIQYLTRQATADMKVTSVGTSRVSSGVELARSLEQMVDFKRYSEKASRRLQGDSRLLEKLLLALGGKRGVLREDGITLRSVFQDYDLMVRIKESLKKRGYPCKLSRDEEHNLGVLETHTSAGLPVKIDWNLASYVEFQKATELFIELEDRLVPPFIVGENGGSEEIATREALLERVLTSAKKDLTIQRYKGLGEMNPEQLWETTMNPKTRTLLKVGIDDAVEAEQIFSTLMGDSVELRRKFIEDNALDVRNLDI